MSDNFLKKLPISKREFSKMEIFKSVPFEKLANFLLECSLLTIKKDEILIDPKKPKKNMFILLKGFLKVDVTTKNEGDFLYLITPGHCVGEMSVFDNMPPSALVIAKNTCKVLCIPTSIAFLMLQTSHELCLNFLHILSERLRNNNLIVCEEQYRIKQIEEIAQIDPMTGLHNRRWLNEMYTREINRSNRSNLNLSAFMIDIDHFKKVNDSYGHIAGDKVLIAIGKALIKDLRPSDMPVRYGGEEFSVFLPGTSQKNAKTTAERIRKNIEKMIIELSNDAKIQITISIGYSSRKENDTVESLLHRADKALYKAKQNGRNQIYGI